jgi:hypothetical protein
MIYKEGDGLIPVVELRLLHLGFFQTHYNCVLLEHNQEDKSDLLPLLGPQPPIMLKCCSVNLAYIGNQVACMCRKTFTLLSENFKIKLRIIFSGVTLTEIHNQRHLAQSHNVNPMLEQRKHKSVQA